MNRSQALSSAVPQRRAVSAWSFAMRTFHSTRTPRHSGISGNLARKMAREVQLEDGAAALSPEHERSTPGCPLRCRGSSTRATSAWVLMPAHSRLRPPPPQHLGTTGWAGDKPAAFNSGFMAATDPKLTFRHYSV